MLSPRLAAIIDQLPIGPASRVLEIGCGPGAAARAVAARLESGHILAIDRSATAVAQALAASAAEIDSGRLSVRRTTIEDFELLPGENTVDIVFAVRVGALDGRHPMEEAAARARIAAATTPDARLFIDGTERSIDRWGWPRLSMKPTPPGRGRRGASTWAPHLPLVP